MNGVFAQLDLALLAACDHEEQRAAPIPEPGAGAPQALDRLTTAFDLSPLESAVLLLVLAPHVEPRYRTLYGVLQDALSECWPTERLLLTVLGRTPERR